jgi:hypothetical protein
LTTAADGKKYTTKYYNPDAFLQFNQYDMLNNPVKVSAAVAKETAEKEYEKFRIIQDEKFISDFDEEVKKLKKKNKGKTD